MQLWVIFVLHSRKHVTKFRNIFYDFFYDFISNEKKIPWM